MTQELVPSQGFQADGRTGAGILTTFLSLASDAVVVFDQKGSILLANEEAERTLGHAGLGLVGVDVRSLFPPVDRLSGPDTPFANTLPFPLDGTSCVITQEGVGGLPSRTRVRCVPVRDAVQPIYLLLAQALRGDDGMAAENQRLVDELSRANRRLSGTLDIVLGTLDSLDLGSLFSRVLSEITETMDAWATLAYMAERDGYRLRGSTESVQGAPVPTFVPFDDPLAAYAARMGTTVRVRVMPPTREELRQGELTQRTVRDETSERSITIDAGLLPPFVSFALVPVWFGGQMISLLEVGWKRTHRIREDDARLLDAVAEYLSVQLAGAYAALRAQHADQLESLASALRERLLSTDVVTYEELCEVYKRATQGMQATCVPLVEDLRARQTTAKPEGADIAGVPVDLGALCKREGVPSVMDVTQVEGLAEWLVAQDLPSMGLLALLGASGEEQRAFLLLRPADDEPFDESDQSFARRLADDVMEVEAGVRVRSRDKRIAHALQLGMRNELQKVEGLQAQSCYSSATEAAYVGGDFYDLVRLPERRACVIMGDVSGKGVEAASVSSAVKTALGAYAWEGISPARMVSLLNDFLLGFSRIETFATLFVGIVDLADGSLTYCSAGHPPALLVRAASGELAMLDVQSGVVGAFENMRYRNGQVTLDEGDTLVLYTDGVTEARDPQGAFFGEDGLRDVVSREVAAGFGGLCERMLDSVASFAGGSLEDDVALVVLRVDELGQALVAEEAGQ